MDAVQIRKALIFTVRTCYRLVCRHPFLVGMGYFLIFLYRSFPFMFSLLVSASPVLVSTAILLGTLLSLGNPNIPEIEKEEETTHESLSLKTGVPKDSIVVERDERYEVERYTESRRNVEEDSFEEAVSSVDDSREVDKDDTVTDGAMLMEEKTRDFQFDTQETVEEGRESREMVFEKENDLDVFISGEEELPGNQYSPIQHSDEKILDEFETEKLLEGYGGSETVDQNSPLGSPWNHEDEGEEEEDDVSDSGSDGDESSSPDASMADIIPMLDELHPLLDDDAPQPAHMYHEGSDVASEDSPKSFRHRSNGLDEDLENHEDDLEVGDGEDGEEAHIDKDDETKSAIKWTEDDQKNLMDLGTSELERNQRLENLIARRRLRKIMAEKNLIDFDTTDRPFNIADISTKRHNPFDLPYDDMGLPPMPGSAPSIMAQRRNPFDLPYDSSEEKPDLMDDNFQEEVMSLQPKEPLFRRNETFNVGPSIFGTSRHDNRFRPYFVPELMAAEGTSYSFLHRQISDLSDSKASSVPETELISSVEDLEDMKAIEEDLSNLSELISTADPELISVPEPELISVPETELKSIAKGPSEHVGHGSDSSEDEDSFDLHLVEKRDAIIDGIELKSGDVENYQETVSGLSGITTVATLREPDESEIHLNAQTFEQKLSSLSSVSEVDEDMLAGKEGEQLSSSEPLSALSHQPSMENSDKESTSQLMVNTEHKEPIYDSSPIALEKNLSSSSMCSDHQVEISETSSVPVSIKRMISFTERDSEVSYQSIEKNIPAVEVGEKLVSIHYEPPLEETLLPQLEKELPLSDQAVDEPSPGNPEEVQDLANSLDDFEIQEVDNRTLPYNNPLETHRLAPMQSEVIEIKAPLVDFEDTILDTTESSEQIQCAEQHTLSAEPNDSLNDVKNNIDDLDDIEEIEERLLLELDAVGDFSIEGLRSNFNESSGGSLHMHHDFGNSSEDVQSDPVVTRVIYDDEDDFTMIKEHINKPEGEIEAASEFQVSGKSSVTNVYSAEIFHEELLGLAASDMNNEKPMPEETAVEPAESKVVQYFNAKEINADTPAEEREIKDVQFSYIEAEPMSSEMNVDNSFEYVESNSVVTRVIVDDEENLSMVKEHASTLEGEMAESSENQASGTSSIAKVDSSVGEIIHEEVLDPTDSIINSDEPMPEEIVVEPADSKVVQHLNAKEINTHTPDEVREINDIDLSYKDAEPMLLEMHVGNSFEDVESNPVVTRDIVDNEENLSMVKEHIGKVEGEIEEASEYQVFGTSSAKNVDSSIEEIVHEKVEVPTSSTINKDDPISEETTELKVVQYLDAEEIKSDTDVEVREIKDIDVSYKEAESMSSEIDVEFKESETGKRVRGIEDIESAITQVNENFVEKPLVVDSLDAKLSPDETGGYSQHELLHEGSVFPQSTPELTILESKSVQDCESNFEERHGGIVGEFMLNDNDLDHAECQDLVGSPSEVHVGEARSKVDTIAALAQVSEINVQKLPLSNSEKELPESESNEVFSSKSGESCSEVSGVLQNSSATAEEQTKEVKTSEDFKKSNVKHKKDNSSSSSSSSSDSGKE